MKKIEEKFNYMKEIAEKKFADYYEDESKKEKIIKTLEKIEKRSKRKLTYTVGEINAYLG